MSITDALLSSGSALTDEAGNSRSVDVTVSSSQSRLLIGAVRMNAGGVPVVKFDGSALTAHTSGINDTSGGGWWSVVAPAAGSHTIRFETGFSTGRVGWVIIEVAGDQSTVLAVVSPSTGYSTSYAMTLTGTTTTSKVYALAHRGVAGLISASAPLSTLYSVEVDTRSVCFASRAGAATSTGATFTAPTSQRFGGSMIALEADSGGSPSNAPRSQYYHNMGMR